MGKRPSPQQVVLGKLHLSAKEWNQNNLFNHVQKETQNELQT